MDFAHIFKNNPNHDKDGRFAASSEYGEAHGMTKDLYKTHSNVAKIKHFLSDTSTLSSSKLRTAAAILHGRTHPKDKILHKLVEKELDDRANRGGGYG